MHSRCCWPPESDRPLKHPGLLHTKTDLDRMKAMVARGAQPWSLSSNRPEGATSMFISIAISLLSTLLLAQVALAQGPFVHPGGLHTQADLDRMAAQVAAGAPPWVDSWNVLVANPHASLGWRPRPVATVIRGGTGENYSLLYNDTAAAYACALRWYISGDIA